MKFELLNKDPLTKARAGKITTDHCVIETPIFMPVGTVASVKGVHQRELKEEINPDIIISIGICMPQNDIHIIKRSGIANGKIIFRLQGIVPFMARYGGVLFKNINSRTGV
jgi:tRNA-guanine family transglycosylase